MSDAVSQVYRKLKTVVDRALGRKRPALIGARPTSGASGEDTPRWVQVLGLMAMMLGLIMAVVIAGMLMYAARTAVTG